MGSIGTGELILIFLVALLVFGPNKLPELGKSLGKAIREFKRASSELRETLEREVEEAQRTGPPPPPPSPAMRDDPYTELPPDAGENGEKP